MVLRRLLHATLLSLLLYACGAAACFSLDRLALRQLAAFSLRQNPTASFPIGFVGYGGELEAKPTTAFVGWNGEDCCSWRGVVCSSANYTAAARISKLLLSKVNLVGAIPQAICSLSALSTLDLSDNFLTGSIPTCFAHNLTNLRHLDLSYNYLNGTMLPVNNLTDLLHLDLSYNNYFHDPVFEAICSLSALSTLDLSHNFLIGSSIPTCFAYNLTNLRHLDLSSNYLNGTTLPISALPHLTYLDLSENVFDSIPPFQIPRLRWLLLQGLGAIPIFTNGTSNYLQHLDLSSNFFTSGISNLFNFPLLQLQYLDLSYSDLSSDKIPVTAITSQLPQLRTLLLNFTMIGTEGQQISELLCGLKSLEVLSVRGDRDESLGSDSGNLEGEMLLPARCKSPSLNLTFLDVSNNKLSGPFPAWLSLFSNLQVLRLSGNNFDFYSSAITPEWQNLTHLTVLQLSGPTAKPFLLPQHMQISRLFRLPLETLTLSSLGISNQHIPCSQLSLLNTSLHYLDFSNNLLTGAHALHCLAQSNFTLETLDLSQNALAFNLALAFPPSLVKTGLILNACELNGELTDEFFGMLRSIRYVNTESQISLAQNSFSGALPSGIGVLVGVDILDLSYNDFTGRIPPSLGNMSDLMHLRLESNHLEGEVPQELRNMSELNVLFLGNNKLTKWHPAKYGRILILDLSYNRLEGDLEQTFFGHYSLLETVAVLLLGHNRLSGAIPHTLFNGTTAHVLSIIQLSDNRLTGTIPHTLFNLFPSLTLDPPGGYIGGIGFERTFTLVVKNLELSYDSRSAIFTYLDLSNNQLNGFIPESLGQLSRLIYLNLSRNQLTGNIPSSLSNLSLLESLDLSYNRLQGSLPTSLSKLTKLAVFNVSFNEELSGPIPTNSPQLEDNTSYIGDLKLCGDPYLQRCPHMEANVVSYPEEDHKIEERESFLMQWIDEWIAIPGLCLGIVVGFLGALWVLRLISFI